MNFRFALMSLLSALVLFGCVWVFTQLLLIGRWSGGKYDRPIVGILTQPLDQTQVSSDYISGPLTKFVESFGGRVVPVDWRQPLNVTEVIINELNGVIIPGGVDTKLVNDDGSFTAYLKSAFTILDFAKLINDKGDYFPVLGVGNGHLAIFLYDTKDASILTESIVEDQTENPNFPDVKSRMFNLSTEDSLSQYSQVPIGWSMRTQCITLATFAS